MARVKKRKNHSAPLSLRKHLLKPRRALNKNRCASLRTSKLKNSSINLMEKKQKVLLNNPQRRILFPFTKSSLMT
jgi:hypothetical protein